MIFFFVFFDKGRLHKADFCLFVFLFQKHLIPVIRFRMQKFKFVQDRPMKIESMHSTAIHDKYKMHLSTAIEKIYFIVGNSYYENLQNLVGTCL